MLEVKKLGAIITSIGIHGFSAPGFSGLFQPWSLSFLITIAETGSFSMLTILERGFPPSFPGLMLAL